MAVTFAVGVRACCAAGLLLLAARAGEPVSPLVGATRDQVLLRYGEPRSQIETGNRVILFYPNERLVLRDDVVVEVERFAADSASPAANPSPEASEPNPGETEPPGDDPQTPPIPSPAAEPKFEIKLVRPPSSKGSQPPAATTTQPEPILKPATPPTVVPTIVPAETSTAAESHAAPTAPEENAPSADSTTAPAEADRQVKRKKVAEDLAAETQPVLEAEAPPPPSPAPSVPEPPPEPGVLSGRTYVIALIVGAGGLAFLFWRRRQRQSELEASSVENTSLRTNTAAPFTGNAFTADQLKKLDKKRFEELVAGYYSKTGVVALRTKEGADSPVHIKISWKGEPRPFAYVQCISHPVGLIDVTPLRALLAALLADDIRRGYVVTTGKFNVLARDFAEEKHLTLLPGEVFIEKLNALPVAARTEIMHLIHGGGATIPSCPKCNAKMVQSDDKPPMWRCPNHPDQTIPVQR